MIAHFIPPLYAKPDEKVPFSENNESIYRIIKEPTPEVKKEKRYVSKHKFMVVQEIKDRLQSHRTMGPERITLATPQEFLKKHSKEPVLPPRKPFRYPDSYRNRPQVPSFHFSPPMKDVPMKNLIRENVRNAIRMTPPKLDARQVDARNGDWMDLEPAGLIPKYVRKKEYGMVPLYLIKRKEDMMRSERLIEEYVNEQYHKTDLPRVTDSDKYHLIKDLRKNWDHLNRLYLTQSLVCDTFTKIWTKEELERRLGKLERDIDVLSRYENIYIAPHGF